MPLASTRICEVNIRAQDIGLGCSINSSIHVVSNPLRSFINIIRRVSTSGSCIHMIISVFKQRAPIRLRLTRTRPVRSWSGGGRPVNFLLKIWHSL